MRKQIAAAAIAATVLGSAGVGALAFGPTFAGAQDASTTSDPAAGQPAEGQGARQTVEDVLATLVADGTITQAQADAVGAALAEARPAGGHGGPGGPGRGGPGGGAPGAGLSAAADAIGISEDDLRTALEGGQTLAQVAEANGVDVQTVIDALVAEAQARIDEKVASGDLTQEEGDAKKAELSERITERVNNPKPAGGPEGRGGRGGPRGERPADGTAPEAPADDSASS